MRSSIINISLPKVMAEEVQNAVKKGQFASTSEFFRFLWRKWKIEQFAKELEADRKEFEAGKGIKLRSLSDLE